MTGNNTYSWEKILIVNDNIEEASRIKEVLETAGYLVIGIARSANLALDMIENKKPSMVILDISLKGSLTGIHLGKMLKDRNLAFIYLSENSSRETVEMVKTTEPYGFLIKPAKDKDLLVTIEIALHTHRQRAKFQPAMPRAKSHQFPRTSRTISTPDPRPPAEIIGQCQTFQAILQNAELIAPTDISVLLLGETGTGKEVIASMIHRLSKQKDGPFIKLNCAALPPSLIESLLFGHEQGAFTGATQRRRGKFEQADNGTIFLDEIGEMGLDMQVKLLRVLQEKEVELLGGEQTIKVNCRVIAATNRDLDAEVEAGRFRMDLFYRLNVLPLTLPPLRERLQDIPALAHYFMQKYSRKLGKPVAELSDNAIADLQRYPWPGNIRELENAIERVVLLNRDDTIQAVALPGMSSKNTDQRVPDTTMEDVERRHIIQVLRQCGGKIAGKGGAAEFLKIHSSTLNSRIKKLGIHKVHEVY
jgi:two-component system response regulator HydG